MKQLFTISTIAVTQNTSDHLIFYLKVYKFHHMQCNKLFTRTFCFNRHEMTHCRKSSNLESFHWPLFSLPTMDKFMHLHNARLSKRFITVLAEKWLLPAMHQSMHRQCAPSSKKLTTRSTAKWILSAMD